MSLYYEAASILQNADNVGGSLTSRIYGKKGLKSKPTAVYALVTESTRWSAVLKDVVENSGILKLEKKLTPLLAVLLTHDLLVSKGGVAAPAQHPLKLAITRHKARLSAEFTKIRVKRGFGTLDAFRQAINGSAAPDGTSTSARGPEHPRWVRVNAVRTTLAAQLRTTFAGYERKDSLSDVMAAAASAKVLHVDVHIPNLLALPPRADLSRVPAYRSGELIIQDKASCFPAYLLDAQPSDGDAIDGCAAPGNKTTHLAAIIAARQHQKKKTGGDEPTPPQRIIACERDKRRSLILAKMVRLAGADHLVTVHPSQDFLDLDPTSSALSRVGAILLDPSCSGSGIVSRDDDVKLELPSAAHPTPQGKKRKRGGKAEQPHDAATTTTIPLTEHDADSTTTPLSTRLAALSSFQLRLLTRAMSFPAARRIAYSTCSVHAAENEGVVAAALRSRVAVARGWRLLRREEQVAGMRAWGVRGEGADGVGEACIRCEKGTAEGTMGFFVAGFVREGEDGGEDGGEWGGGGVEGEEGEGEDEWNGFSDDD